MVGYKLFRLVSVLAKNELAEADKFLQSPFYNTHKECQQLFRQLCRFHPEMDNSKLTKEYLFARVYGKTPFDDGKMRKLMTRLTQLLEQYLAVKEIGESDDMYNHALITSLSKRSDYQLFMEASEQRIRTLESRPGRGREYFREVSQIYQMDIFHPETAKFTTGHDYFYQYITNFERYFLLTTLQNGTEQIIRHRLVPGDNQIMFLDAVSEIAKREELQSHPIIGLFYRLFKIYQSPGEKVDLDELNKLLDSSFNQLGGYEQRMALKLSISYAIPFVNEGSAQHIKFAFELYKLAAEKDLLIIGESAINTDLFLNIHTMGMLAGELAWTRNFADDYGHLLPEDDRDVALQYCTASWHYYNALKIDDLAEFENSLMAINLIPVRATEKFDLRARTLQLRVKYELFKRNVDSLDEMLATSKNFKRHLLANHTYSDSMKDMYIHFINRCNSLARLTNKPDLSSVEVDKLMEEINHDKKCLFRSWLRDQIEELISARQFLHSFR